MTRRVWSPIGERPIAPGHHCFDWLYVTAFVSPASGETFWYVRDGVSKPFFSALLETFAREAGAGVDRTVLLVLDNAGWHGEAGLSVPNGVRLVFPPAEGAMLSMAIFLSYTRARDDAALATVRKNQRTSRTWPVDDRDASSKKRQTWKPYGRQTRRSDVNPIVQQV